MKNAMMTEYWKPIFDSMHNGVVVVGLDGKVLQLNASAQKLLQVHDGEWEGVHITSIIPNTKLHQVGESGLSTIGEKMEIQGRMCMVNRTPLYRGDEVVGAIGVIQDISEMEHYISLLKQLDSIVEFSTDGIYVVDRYGKTLMVNTAYEQITGFTRQELVGRHMADLTEEGYFDQSVSLLVLEQKKQISLIQKINRKKEVIVTGNPVFDSDGHISMVVTSVRDITQLNEMKQELNKAKSFSQIQNHRYTLMFDGQEHSIVFRGDKMRRIYEQIRQIAPFPTSIMISGPSGAGKEVIANLIHHMSDRKDQPFIKVNCAAIPEALLESELFGYEAGAFTGAQKEGRIGLLELADKGTILLDEIGEMPLPLQVKLLRVLQEKQVQRIGSSKVRKLDIRILSATNRDLRERIQAGQFREDLYYRLLVVELQIPPLSERPEDVAALIDHFFQYYCKAYRIDKQLSEETRHLLNGYHWPGNVRELRNLIENLIVSVPSTVIETHHLPRHIYESGLPDNLSSLKARLEEFEKRAVREALEKHGSIRKAALALGLDHSTLVKKMKRWNP
ncbi:sigma-54 interaction domain-containing protein [Paenibacillus thalictri]|uniref:HTH-type transcriptional regulatory protein TyrR n=1 Tax=Paenibacillus thalictri TaxID=2527873 RepID=A0A4Q9DT80_9BACL|nr:sigma 54-interacting transcriptional regulator [Paenibacillus thalictri]TBL78562.1 PAS domain S-box protein [Paenibacillus thalictri]